MACRLGTSAHVSSILKKTNYLLLPVATYPSHSLREKLAIPCALPYLYWARQSTHIAAIFSISNRPYLLRPIRKERKPCPIRKEGNWSSARIRLEEKRLVDASRFKASPQRVRWRYRLSFVPLWHGIKRLEYWIISFIQSALLLPVSYFFIGPRIIERVSYW